MNQIVNLNSASTLTMSSREIAKLTGKAHRNVMRDASHILSELYEVRDLLRFEHIYLDTMNRQQKELLLPKRETLILVSGYSVTLRTRIIDRWMELEAQAAPQSVASVDVSALVSQLAQLVQALTPLVTAVSSGNQQAVTPVPSKPRFTEDDFKPLYSAAMVREMTDNEKVVSMSNSEIGYELTYYSKEKKFPIEWRKRPGSVNKYCRAAIESLFGSTL